jgi:hypothetical protein
MAIDVSQETILPLGAVPHRFPHLGRRTPDGKRGRIHFSTVFRWFSRGVVAPFPLNTIPTHTRRFHMNRSRLMLHVNAHAVEREHLALVATPERTRTWVPIPHHHLLDTVQHTLAGAGLAVVSESHGLTKDGARYFGLLQVANGHNPEDFGLVVGVRNSHDQSFPAGLVCGAAVFVCDNLSFSGEVRLARKHTAFIQRDLPGLVAKAVGKLTDQRDRQERRFVAYKGQKFSDQEAHDLLIRALDARALPVTRIPAALAEWRSPRHAEFGRDGKTGWLLFNAVTEALKGGGLMDLPRRTQALHGLLDLACGLTVPATVPMPATPPAAEPHLVQAV